MSYSIDIVSTLSYPDKITERMIDVALDTSLYLFHFMTKPGGYVGCVPLNEHWMPDTPEPEYHFGISNLFPNYVLFQTFGALNALCLMPIIYMTHTMDWRSSMARNNEQDIGKMVSLCLYLGGNEICRTSENGEHQILALRSQYIQGE